MATSPSSPPSQASPDHQNAVGVLHPPPLQSFLETDPSFKSDMNFTLRITEKLNEKNFHLWRH
jgi:hypothetical protein